MPADRSVLAVSGEKTIYVLLALLHASKEHGGEGGMYQGQIVQQLAEDLRVYFSHNEVRSILMRFTNGDPKWVKTRTVTRRLNRRGSNVMAAVTEYQLTAVGRRETEKMAARLAGAVAGLPA